MLSMTIDENRDEDCSKSRELCILAQLSFHHNHGTLVDLGNKVNSKLDTIRVLKNKNTPYKFCTKRNMDVIRTCSASLVRLCTDIESRWA